MKDLNILKEKRSYIQTNITLDHGITRGIENDILASLITSEKKEEWGKIKDKDPIGIVLVLMCVIAFVLYIICVSTNVYIPYIAPHIDRASPKYLIDFVVVTCVLDYLVYRLFREEPMKHELGKKLHDQFVSDVQASFEQYKSKLYREAIDDIFGVALIERDIKFGNDADKFAVPTRLVGKYLSLLLEGKELPKIQGKLFNYQWDWDLRVPIKIKQATKLRSMKMVDGHIWFITEGEPYTPNDSKCPELIHIEYHEKWYIH